MRVYLSHPYGGKEANREKAAAVAKLYREMWDAEGKTDWKIVNPLEELEHVNFADDDTALFAAVALMKTCDIVLFAPGWKRSRGCRYERMVARHTGKTYHEIPAEAEAIAVHWYGRHHVVVKRRIAA